MLMTKSPQGQAIQMRVSEVRDKTVIVDLIHPLAGKTRRESYRHQGRPDQITSGPLYPSKIKKPGVGHPQPGHNMGFRLSPLFVPISARLS